MHFKFGKRLHIFFIIAALIIAFILSPLFPYARSLIVMKIYSASCEKGSLPDTNGFEVYIPSGGSWYPFVMSFSDDAGFSAYTQKEDTQLTIFYNFPEFSLTKGCSRLYDESSPYYSAFYGAYFVSQGDGEAYGFMELTSEQTDEKTKETKAKEAQTCTNFQNSMALDSDAVAAVARFDFFELVLSDFGLEQKDRVFSYTETDRQDNVSFIGYEGWTRIECDLTVNGAAHKKKGFVRSYLQYGEPRFKCEEDFAPVNMHGIIIARYFEELDVSAFFYVMAPDDDVCLTCERDILMKSKLKTQI